MFLDSDWWINLSRLKRRQVGKCERCGVVITLQSHHIHYPDNWFDTRLEDLEVLCCSCHEKEHGIVPVKPDPPKVAPIIDLKRIRSARSMGAISRQEYVRMREKLTPKVKAKKWRSSKSRKKSRKWKRRLGLDFESKWRRNVRSGNWSC